MDRSVSRILSPRFAEASRDGRPSIWDRDCSRPRASYQSCSCTGQGFPRRHSHGCPAWALTPRFQPYLAQGSPSTPSFDRLKTPLRTSPSLTLGFGRCVFCCTFPGLEAIGLSSVTRKKTHLLCSRSPLATVHFLAVAGRGVFGLSSPALFYGGSGRPTDRACPIGPSKNSIKKPFCQYSLGYRPAYIV